MLREYVEFRQGLVTVLLGLPRAIPDLPYNQRPNARVGVVLRSLPASPGEVRRLRAFLVKAGVAAGPLHYGRDSELIEHALRSLQSGRLRALVLANASAKPQTGGASSGGVPAVVSPAAKSPRAQQPGKLPGVKLPGTVSPASQTQALKPTGTRLGTGPELDAQLEVKPFAQWTTEERIAELVRLTRKRVPGDVGEALESLLTTENLAITAGVMMGAAAAQFTPYGWIADAALAGAAFVFGGLAAVAALKNLADAIILTANARRESDLEAAAEELSAAVIAMGSAAVVALLRRVAGRGAKGSSGPDKGADKVSLKQTKPHTPPPPPAVKPAQGVQLPAEVASSSSASLSRASASEAKSALKKIVTKDGTKITGFTNHGLDRIIGDGRKRAGVKTSAWKDALENPRRIREGIDDKGRPYKEFKGKLARVIVNPKGEIVSVNPLGRAGVR